MRKLKHYKTIQEFQDEFPNKRKRDAFIATLSNEEIDELIDLCGMPQGIPPAEIDGSPRDCS